MNIRFITSRLDHDPLIYKVKTIKIRNSLSSLRAYILKGNVVRLGIDIETTRGRLFFRKALLISIGDEKYQWVLDLVQPPSIAKMLFSELVALVEEFPEMLWIGHNLHFDMSVLQPLGLKLRKIWDTMVAEQRLGLGSGRKNSLDAVWRRRLKEYMFEEKETRLDFLDMTRKSKLLFRHVNYSAGDIVGLPKIVDIQQKLLDSNNLNFLVKEIEFNVIHEILEAHLEGMAINESLWGEILKKSQVDLLKKERLLDSIVLELGKGEPKLLGGKFNSRRNKVYAEQIDIFGESKISVNKNLHNINYGSGIQIFPIFTTLSEPLPLFKNTKKEMSPSIRKEALEAWLIANPDSKMYKFVYELLDRGKIAKSIDSFGYKFIKSEFRTSVKAKAEIGYKNPKTNKVHTIYKQCFTETARLSSGDSKQGLYNSQQVPAMKFKLKDSDADKKAYYRLAFTLTDEEIAQGYHFTTCDLSGAELIIMSALADDQHLYSLGKDDLHSPIATKCWRAVAAYRKENGLSMYIKTSQGDEVEISPDIVIDKSTNTLLRTDFKSMTFGTIYGLKAKKGGETLRIPKGEAQIVIDIITQEFPRTFKMVEAAADEALLKGMVIFNNRTYSRRIFTPVFDARQPYLQQLRGMSNRQQINFVKRQLDYTIISDIEGAARNCRIQGTQADMVKEAKVNIRKYARSVMKDDLKLCLSVHDELGYKHLDKEFGQVINRIMTDTANEYLKSYSSNIRMGAEHETLLTWTK